MIQIGILLMCVFLIYKGKELELIAAASLHEDREKLKRSASRWSGGALVVALIFAFWAIVQGAV